MSIKGGFEEADVQGVVLLSMDPKIFDFVEGDGLVLGYWFVRWFVALHEATGAAGLGHLRPPHPKSEGFRAPVAGQTSG